MIARRGEAGLTLLEVMVAVFVLSMMMVLCWTTVFQTARAKTEFTAAQERYREARIVLSRMARDLSMAYLSGNEDRSLLEPRTYFKSDSGGDYDSVRFSALSHMRMFENSNESDQTVIGYYTAPDRDNGRKTNLMRRELRRPGNEAWDSMRAETAVALGGIEKLNLEYWDWQDREWQEEWDSNAADGQPNRLPERVRITITFLDHRGEEVELTTQVRLAMQEMVQGYAN